jgi:hypothetical protein
VGENSSVDSSGQRIIRRKISALTKNIGSSLAKNFRSEESSGEELSASRDFFRAKNYPAKNTPSEEYSQRKLRLAKNTPSISEESSGPRILR